MIDGHNREMIADSLGIDYPSEVRTGLSESQKRLLAVDLNLARRQLTDAQKATLGRTIEPDVEAEARRRQIELAGTRRDTLGSNEPKVDEPKGKSRAEVAKKVGLGSGSTYERAKQVLEAVEAQPDGATLTAQVKDGSLDLKAAKQELVNRGVEWNPVRWRVSPSGEPSPARMTPAPAPA